MKGKPKSSQQHESSRQESQSVAPRRPVHQVVRGSGEWRRVQRASCGTPGSVKELCRGAWWVRTAILPLIHPQRRHESD